MLVDEVIVQLKAGSGGRGAVKFNKTKMALGPVGGSGGKGGSIYLEGVSDITALASLASRKIIKSEDGERGQGQFVDGADGKDVILRVPNNTRVVNVETGQVQEITSVGERVLIAAGGKGGKGNYLFRSATNTSPQQFEE